MSSNLVAVSLGICVVGLLLYFLLPDERMLAVAAFGFVMMLPLGTMFSPSKNRYVLLTLTVALAAAGAIAIGLVFSTGEIYNMMTLVFIFGFVVFQWTANYMLIKEDNQ